jgi:hypothetical protein
VSAISVIGQRVGGITGASVVVRLRVVLDRLARHAIVPVHPPGKILELAPLAAEGNPRRLRWLATTEHAHAAKHTITIDLKI